MLHHFFSNTTPHFGSLRSLPKTDCGEKIKLLVPDEKTHGLGIQRESCKKRKMASFRRFWVKQPRQSENISDEKCYLCRSTRLYTVPESNETEVKTQHRRHNAPGHTTRTSCHTLSGSPLSLGHGIAANSGSWGLKTPVMAGHRLHRIPLAAVVVCLSSLQRQQLTACCCLLACARQSDTRRYRDKEDEIGHKHKRTRRSCERTGYYFAVPAVGPCLDAQAD